MAARDFEAIKRGGEVLPAPSQLGLDGLWREAVQVRLVTGCGLPEVPMGMSAKHAIDPFVVVVLERDEIPDLRLLFAIHDGGESHCLCGGGCALLLIGHDDRVVARLTLHHGVSIRWDGWHSDADLMHRDDIADWFEARHISELLR